MSTLPDLRQICLALNENTPVGGLFEGNRENLHPDSNLPWRISPEPFWINDEQVAELEKLGKSMCQFFRAANTLYHQSVKGLQPNWVHQYLDQGKPSDVIEMGRWNRTKSHLPIVMRPDLLLTDNGFRIMEMDSIPGGIGFTAQISRLYKKFGYNLIGGENGLIEGLYNAVSTTTESQQPVVVIVVSDESESYREEMQWIAQELSGMDKPTYCVHPREILFDNEGLFIRMQDNNIRIDAIYRFYELFDLKNIPKSELISYFTKKNAVRITPPSKAYLEEKIWLALFHNPQLATFWKKELQTDAYTQLREMIPQTWILDPQPIPPHASVSNLEIDGLPISNWTDLKGLSKKQRELIIKPSGFSELAYESKGILIGHDMSEESWDNSIQMAMNQFNKTPYVLQKFHKAKRKTVNYYDFSEDKIKSMKGRTLLRPYYYVIDKEPKLAGIQAVVCPPDKKIIHGMIDAVIAPCGIKDDSL